MSFLSTLATIPTREEAVRVKLREGLMDLSKEQLVDIMFRCSGATRLQKQLATERALAGAELGPDPLPLTVSEEVPSSTEGAEPSLIAIAPTQGGAGPAAGPSGAEVEPPAPEEPLLPACFVAAELAFRARQLRREGFACATSAVAPGLRVFRAGTATVTAGKMVAVPPSEHGEQLFSVQWAKGRWPRVQYTGTIDRLSLADLSALHWHAPPPAAACPPTASPVPAPPEWRGGVLAPPPPPPLPALPAASWSAQYFSEEIEHLCRRDSCRDSPEGTGIFFCLQASPDVGAPPHDH